MSYKPPYVITPIIVSLVAKISEKLGQLSVLKLRKTTYIYAVLIAFALFKVRWQLRGIL
ncbi:hypothetical protein BSPWISOXPB_892 [uncultured Gammaproteobacteria bacterium]|nr:hypothetical protein BSPWISOXPB_892 [uncultured Gammaproteobacteria bacterium]